MVVFFHLPGWRSVGYEETHGSGDDMPFEHDFAPFGPMPGFEEWGSAWWQSCADSLDEAVARLKDWMQVIGLQGEPIVAEDLPRGAGEPPEGWDADHARAVVLDEMMACGVEREDIFRGCDDDDEGHWWGEHLVMLHPVEPGGCVQSVRLRRGRPFPLMPSTTEREIRDEARRWAYELKTAWSLEEEGTADEDDAAYARRMRELLPATYTKRLGKLAGFVTAREAAEMLGYTPHHVALLARRGDLPRARAVGGAWWIPKESVEGYRPDPPGPKKGSKNRKKKAPPEGETP